MAGSDEEGHPRGVVLVDAAWKYCPTEWQEWTDHWFRQPPPEDLQTKDPEAYREWLARYPGRAPDGPPSSWTWVDGEARTAWLRYPTTRNQSQVALPKGESLADVWRALRKRLLRGELSASGFRDGSLHIEEIPSEAWERLEWDMDVQASRVTASGLRIEEIRILERSAAAADVKEELHPTKTGAPGPPSSMHLVEDEFRNRVTRKNMEASLSEQARVLLEWLHTTHPRAPRPTEKTIQNRLRRDYRIAANEMEELKSDPTGRDSKRPK